MPTIVLMNLHAHFTVSKMLAIPGEKIVHFVKYCQRQVNRINPGLFRYFQQNSIFFSESYNSVRYFKKRIQIKNIYSSLRSPFIASLAFFQNSFRDK